jgi:hypothetical protein
VKDLSLNDAKSICHEWFAYIKRQEENTVTLQKAAALARAGNRKEAMRLKNQVDTQPKIYDGARLMPAVKRLLKEIGD